MKLSTQYYNVTKDRSPFDADWLKAMQTIVNVISEMQEALSSIHPYTPTTLTNELIKQDDAPASFPGI